MKEATLPTLHTFKFNIHNVGYALETFSVSEFNQGIEEMLTRCGYELTEEDRAFRVYSSEERVEPYLVILSADRYKFIFYLPDDESLGEWKKRYSSMTERLWLKTFLPEPPKPFEQVTFTMDLNKAFLSR